MWFLPHKESSTERSRPPDSQADGLRRRSSSGIGSFEAQPSHGLPGTWPDREQGRQPGDLYLQVMHVCRAGGLKAQPFLLLSCLMCPAWLCPSPYLAQQIIYSNQELLIIVDGYGQHCPFGQLANRPRGCSSIASVIPCPWSVCTAPIQIRHAHEPNS